MRSLFRFVTAAFACLAIVGQGSAAVATTINSIAGGDIATDAPWGIGNAPGGANATNDYVINNAEHTVVVNGNYTFNSHSLTVSAGTLYLTTNANFTSESPDFTLAGGTLTFDRGNYSAAWNINSAIHFQDSTTSTITYGYGGYTGTAHLKGALTGGGNITLNFAGNRNNLQVESIDNSFSGNWTVSGTGEVSATTYGLMAIGKNSLGTGTVVLGTYGILRVNGLEAINSVAGVTMNAVSSKIDVNNPWTNTAAFLEANLGTVNVGNAASSIGNLSGTGATAVIQGIGASSALTVNQTTDATYAGSFTQTAGNTLAFTKNGGAKLTLTGTGSTYSGGTTIAAGTLLANNASGSATGTGNVTVNGGTLGGTGFIAGGVILNDNGILSPGASIGSLDTGANTWNGDTTFVMEFSTDGFTGSAGSQWDLLAITGGLDLSGVTSATLNLVTMADANNTGSLASWDPNLNHIWTGFVSTTTGVTGFDANDFAFNTSAFQNALNGTFSVVQNGNNLDLVYTAVPEPGTFAMLLFGGLMMWVLGTKKGCRH